MFARRATKTRIGSHHMANETSEYLYYCLPDDELLLNIAGEVATYEDVKEIDASFILQDVLINMYPCK